MESPIAKRARPTRTSESGSSQHDSIDRRAEQWKTATPGTDDPGFGVTGRIQRIARFIERAHERVARRNGITRRDISLLLALRRSQLPLTPTDLLAEIAITSGGIAKRIDQLEILGFVVRRATSLEDARRVVIELTPKGRRLVDKEVRPSAEAELLVFRHLDAESVRVLETQLRKVLLELEGLETASPAAEALAVEE